MTTWEILLQEAPLLLVPPYPLKEFDSLFLTIEKSKPLNIFYLTFK